MRNIFLVAGLTAALAGAALADNTTIKSPTLNYSSGVSQQVTGPDLKTWEWAYYYDIKERDSAVVVMKPLFTMTNLVGVKGLNLNIEGFGGVSLDTGRMLAGVAGVFKGRVADQVWLGVGPGVTFKNDRPATFGVLGQIQIKF